MQWVKIGVDINTNKTLSMVPEERLLGMVLAGQTGYGKTALMEHFIEQDIRDHTTCIIFDPHGELSERILRIGANIAPEHILFCEIGNSFAYGFNPLAVRDTNDSLEVSQTIDSLMQVFRKHWGDNPAFGIGSRAEWVLSHSFRTILANAPNYTLAEIPLLFSDKAFRDKLVKNVVNPETMQFWGWFRRLEATPRTSDQWQLIESTLTRLSQFLANEWLYRVLYQAKGTIKFHELINSGKTIIFPLPIGKLGEQPASLLGSMLLGKLATTIFGRNEYGKAYPRVHIYIDEYARFSIPLISQLWVQARKFNCGLTTTLQSFSQIKDEESRAALLQAGTIAAFQLIGSDADLIARQMPLPDPASLMKPEPILLYSHTPVEDIWHKGHPNTDIQTIRNNYFSIIGDLEREPKQEYWQFNPSALLGKHPDWRIFDDWEMYRSSASMLKEGLALLNQYFSNWMNHQYLSINDFISDEVWLLMQLLENWGGYLGLRPNMQPYIEEDKWQNLLRRWQDNFARDVQVILDRQKQAWNYRGADTDIMTPGQLKANMRQWGLFRYKDIPIEEISSTFLPFQLPLIRELLGGWHLSSYEIDNLIQWKFREKYFPREAELLAKLIGGILLAEGKMTNLLQKYKEDYRDEMIALIGALENVVRGERTDPDSTDPGKDRFDECALYRGEWQAMGIIRFIDSCRFCGMLLEKEPVFDTSHSYRDVEYNRRTYADLREELISKLVGLPKYEVISPLTDGTISQFKTLPPLEILPGPVTEMQAQSIRQGCQKLLGHPWQEVVRDIQTRQNLPPAKPLI
jgi:hypothetical protein